MWWRKSYQNRRYLKGERLADVMALIKVLALDERSHRSEEGLSGELQGKPSSGDTWTEIACEHPEFFRVKASKENRISLLARHVARNEGERRNFYPPIT
jgi:hypothetical protein